MDSDLVTPSAAQSGPNLSTVGALSLFFRTPIFLTSSTITLTQIFSFYIFSIICESGHIFIRSSFTDLSRAFSSVGYTVLIIQTLMAFLQRILSERIQPVMKRSQSGSQAARPSASSRIMLVSIRPSPAVLVFHLFTGLGPWMATMLWYSILRVPT
jgi:hypothetical protein